jgi:hypothetical protein
MVGTNFKIEIIQGTVYNKIRHTLAALNYVNKPARSVFSYKERLHFVEEAYQKLEENPELVGGLRMEYRILANNSKEAKDMFMRSKLFNPFVALLLVGVHPMDREYFIHAMPTETYLTGVNDVLRLVTALRIHQHDNAHELDKPCQRIINDLYLCLGITGCGTCTGQNDSNPWWKQYAVGGDNPINLADLTDVVYDEETGDVVHIPLTFGLSPLIAHPTQPTLEPVNPKTGTVKVRRGIWSEEENERLAALVAVHGHKWSAIAKLFVRDNGDKLHSSQVRSRAIILGINLDYKTDITPKPQVIVEDVTEADRVVDPRSKKKVRFAPDVTVEQVEQVDVEGSRTTADILAATAAADRALLAGSSSSSCSAVASDRETRRRRRAEAINQEKTRRTKRHFRS